MNDAAKLRSDMKKTMWTLIVGISLASWVARGADEEKKPTPPAAPAPPAGLSGMSRADMMKKYDKNGDGKLDEQERAAISKDRQAEILKKYDKDKDGKLDDNERNAMREDMKKQREEAIARRQAEQKKKEGEEPKK
jgi:hypothetical protein